MKIAYRIRDAGLGLPKSAQEGMSISGISLFPMQGCADGLEGDVVMLMPAYNVTAYDVDTIVDAFAAAVECVLGKVGEFVAGEIEDHWHGAKVTSL